MGARRLHYSDRCSPESSRHVVNGEMRNEATAFALLCSELEKELVRRGFSRSNRSGGVSFESRQSPDVHRFVDVQRLTWANGFGVTLQETRRDGPPRVALLERFAGLPSYSFDGGDPTEAVDAALAHFDQYGIPWLEGDNVQTSATEAAARAGREKTHEGHVEAGTAAFKRGEYTQALDELTKAAAIAPLSDVAEKFLKLARKRVGTG